jgi:hypothetical protein
MRDKMMMMGVRYAYDNNGMKSQKCERGKVGSSE